MKKKFSAPMLALAVGLFIVGCATNHVNWNARVGT